MIVRVFLCALLIGAASVASAQDKPATTQQQPAAQKLTPEQRAAIQKQNQALVQYAESIVAMVDKGQAGQVWDQASQVAQKAVTRDQFIQATEADRSKLGKVDARKVAAVTRSVSKGEGGLPAGNYINVIFATTFASNAKPIRELVSFHEDSDNKWRLSGYTVRPPAAQAAAAK